MGKEIGGLPFTAAGEAAYRANLRNNIDPTSYCLFPGVPRIDHSPFPLEIVQTPSRIALIYEYMRTWRIVRIDEAGHPNDVEPTFMGDSTGRWEGDMLVVDVTGLNDRTWLDSGGHPHSASLHVIERFRRSGPDTIDYEVTVDDPPMYSKPFQNAGVFHRAKSGDRIREYACDENNLDRDQGHLQAGAK